MPRRGGVLGDLCEAELVLRVQAAGAGRRTAALGRIGGEGWDGPEEEAEGLLHSYAFVGWEAG